MMRYQIVDLVRPHSASIGFDGGDVNLMAYVGNNPVMGVDPGGQAGEFFTKQFIDKTIKIFGKPELMDIDPAGRRIILSGLGGAGGGVYFGATIGMPGVVTTVPAAIAGGFVGFAGGLLTQTTLEVLGVGQPIEDSISRVMSGVKSLISNQFNSSNSCNR